MSALGDAVVACARQWLDTPWHHQGRLQGVGVDCVGLLVAASNCAGAQIHDQTDYPLRMNGGFLTEYFERYCDRLNKTSVFDPGDFLAFSMAMDYWHVGIVTSNAPLMMIHSYRSLERVVEHAVDDAWRNRIKSAWRLRDG